MSTTRSALVMAREWANGPGGKAIATGLALIVDDTSVFWQWQADDVLKQPDLVGGCRKEVANRADLPDASNAADRAPQRHGKGADRNERSEQDSPGVRRELLGPGGSPTGRRTGT